MTPTPPKPSNAKKARDISIATVVVWGVATLALVGVGLTLRDVGHDIGKAGWSNLFDNISKLQWSGALVILAWIATIGLAATSIGLPPSKKEPVKSIRIALLSTVVLAPIAPGFVAGITESANLANGSGMLLSVGGLALAIAQAVELHK